MFGVKLTMTLVLYALSLLFLTLMFTSIFSLFALITILKNKMKTVSMFGYDAHFPPQGGSHVLESLQLLCAMSDNMIKIAHDNNSSIPM